MRKQGRLILKGRGKEKENEGNKTGEYNINGGENGRERVCKG